MTLIRKSATDENFTVEIVEKGLRSIVATIEDWQICEEHQVTPEELATCFRDALSELLQKKKSK